MKSFTGDVELGYLVSWGERFLFIGKRKYETN
jgi:hypothetical protein